MTNDLIQRNFEDLMKLSKEDREIVMTYFNNWTESSPCEYEDDDTLQNKYEKMFSLWLHKSNNLKQGTIVDIIDYHDNNNSFQEMASYTEYDVDFVIDAYHLRYENFENDFQEKLEEYLEESEN